MLFLTLVIGFVAGCGRPVATKSKSVVSVEETPAVVLAAAKKREPTVRFDKVIKTLEGIYEVQGKSATGKIIEVEVKESGEVVKVE